MSETIEPNRLNADVYKSRSPTADKWLLISKKSSIQSLSQIIQSLIYYGFLERK